MDGRTKSYRVSRIDAAPEVAIPALQEAYEAIRGKREPLQDILERLNKAVREIGIEPFSSSGFGRYAQKVRDGNVTRPVKASEGGKGGRAVRIDLAQRAYGACASEFGPSVSKARLLTAMLDAVIVETGIEAVRLYVGQEPSQGALLGAS